MYKKIPYKISKIINTLKYIQVKKHIRKRKFKKYVLKAERRNPSAWKPPVKPPKKKKEK